MKQCGRFPPKVFGNDTKRYSKRPLNGYLREWSGIELKRSAPTISKTAIIFFSVIFISGCLTVRLPKVEIKETKEGTRLTWKEVVNQTLRNNPDLVSARYDISSSAQNRNQVVGNFLPTVSGSLERDRLRTTSTADMHDSIEAGISGEQPLFTGFDNTGKFLKAKKDLETSKWSYQETSANARNQLRSSYVALLRLERLLETNGGIAERRKNNAELIRLRYDGGRENLGSALRAEAISDRAAFGVRQTRRQIDSESLLLCRQIGNEFRMPIRVEGDLEKMIPKNIDSVPGYSELAEKVPTVHKLISTAESYKAALISAQATAWPQISGLLDYGYSGNQWSDMRDAFLVGIKVSMPFFSGGKNVEAILKAKADYKSALEKARSAQNDAIAQLADAWTQLKDAVEIVDVQNKFLLAARKRAEIIRAEYATGLVNFQDFDIAEQDLADSEVAYVQSLSNVLLKEANWEFVKGSTLEDALNEK
ncbi:MAG: hypothetical protein A3G33_00150 [Omnitrophica bacterium RIFCSPLOWO2_12_FULL_44_17]|uniref:RND transporter n=1 Tax=Candidatus Danuiimicrobium aquiferis TaxID=1801832 RepID=A0A1G1KUF8_9BACT|nr:MAG: hypothetical protein A3B72_00235 [Omnitrophica bacterium RIFCSPHIGHO2_02_FULL_45_28]OGW91650.1 MAG: hypothetical protein A3E74_00250 [Omnitrophica bacterium RIFCSPHIGHO2_12_FULL_44_12]OGW96209.1 MAG: hypothetical protein A3G33_00150 [Omnitrophica bacterium RIFCSPLOWO2_12_FULL_44_17]OGX02121.1 MAG: hypothetical protein A3J12_01730 [Omnitrophica bacterium RIFCSPLOWO2_02_FULL_44_11]